jgi:DNA adenine methylase
MTVIVPPIKTQGIKTKLIPFILQNIRWDGGGTWIEPFVGSGAVLFNVQPERALVSDINPHIISFYREIQHGTITGPVVRQYLCEQGQRLLEEGESFYYRVRDRFNRQKQPLDLLFLSRACFNGLMRFNTRGEFNVPFVRKLGRFSKAYITKIVNQVEAVRARMVGRDWEFRCCHWRDAFGQAREGDFVYLDPPYIGRHTDYYNRWTEEDAVELARWASRTPAGFALSMWAGNQYRRNEHIAKYWPDSAVRYFRHFYHVGSLESFRHPVTEALVIKKGCQAGTDTLSMTAAP